MKYVGEISFQGVACHKSEATGSVALSVVGTTVEFTMQGFEYYSLDGFPKYISMIYNYSQPYQETGQNTLQSYNSWPERLSMLHDFGALAITLSFSLRF